MIFVVIEDGGGDQELDRVLPKLRPANSLGFCWLLFFLDWICVFLLSCHYSLSAQSRLIILQFRSLVIANLPKAIPEVWLLVLLVTLRPHERQQIHRPSHGCGYIGLLLDFDDLLFEI